MKQPYGRIGGKRFLSKYIVSIFPPEYDVYVEPFFGGGSVFYKIKDYHDHKEVINDIDPKIYTILKMLKNNSEYVDKHINRGPMTKKIFDKIKKKNDGLSLLETMRYSFGAMGRHFYGNTERTIKTDFTKIGERLKNVIIKNESFEKVVKEYDSPTTLFYLDPPYEMTLEQRQSQPYYKFSTITPEDVYNVCKNIKGMFILSYNYSPYIVELFKEFDIKIVKVLYTTGNYWGKQGRTKKEVIIKNY